MLTSFDLIDFDVKSSSNLTHISWKRDIGPTTKGTLKVSFHNGLRYEYYGIPKSLVDQLYEVEQSNGSVGSAFHNLLFRNKSIKYHKL